MELNPKSPFAQTPLSECDNRELDAWAAKLCGWTNVRLSSFDPDGMPPRCELGTNMSIPHYTTNWAAAGPLMERMAKMHHSGDVHLGHLGLPEDAGGWDCGRCHEEENVSEENDTGEWFVDGDTAPLAITRAFIIAAEHAAKGNDDAK